jgi:hypothetical protein
MICLWCYMEKSLEIVPVANLIGHFFFYLKSIGRLLEVVSSPANYCWSADYQDVTCSANEYNLKLYPSTFYYGSCVSL